MYTVIFLPCWVQFRRVQPQGTSAILPRLQYMAVKLRAHNAKHLNLQTRLNVWYGHYISSTVNARTFGLSPEITRTDQPYIHPAWKLFIEACNSILFFDSNAISPISLWSTDQKFY